MSDVASRLVTVLSRDEGFRPCVYQDSMGIFTLGYGRNVDRDHGGGITQEEGLYLLQNDIADRVRKLAGYSWYSSQDEVRQVALADMAFNLGITGLLHFPHFLAAMDKHDYTQAVSELIGTPWHAQVGARAIRIEAMISSGAYPA